MSPRMFLRAQAGTVAFLRHTRLLSCSPAVASGHNRWSKIRHDKGKEDSIKSKARTILSHDLYIASKYGGPDPAMNTRLALAITNAKRGQLSKTSIEHAIAKGQGKSTTGAPLEQVMIEAMLPPSVAAIIECQTENKAKALQDVRTIVIRNGGSLTTTAFFFEKKGKIWFQEQEGIDPDKVMEEAIEAGATDVTTEDSKVVVDTEPSEVMAVCDRLRERLNLQVERADIIYDPKEETAVKLTEEQEEALQRVLDWIETDGSVQNVYINAI